MGLGKKKKDGKDLPPPLGLPPLPMPPAPGMPLPPPRRVTLASCA